MHNFGLLLFLAASLAQVAQASGVVTRCDNASLDAALFNGGVVTITCTGIILALDNPITISVDTTIIGNDRVSIDGGSIARLFVVNPGVTLKLRNLTVAHGYSHKIENGQFFGRGGAVENYGTLIVENCRFRNNRASHGGAIYNAGTLHVTSSTFFSNLAYSQGGAIDDVGDGDSYVNTSFVVNSTFYANFVALDSGSLGGAISSIGGMTLRNSTLALNGAPFAGPVFAAGGGSIASFPAHPITVINTIIASPLSGGNCWGVLKNGGGNLVWPGVDADSTCPGLGAVGDPQFIFPLRNNGGLTETLALASTSPAIDTGIDTLCTALDQRGFFRPQGLHCDIGAFEAATAFTMLSTVLLRVAAERPQSSSASPEQVRGAIVEPLSRSLEAGFWQLTDGNHLNRNQGSAVFAIHEQVVQALTNLVSDPVRFVYIRDLAASDRMLATTVFSDTQCSASPDLGSTNPECRRASAEIAGGDARAESEEYGKAIVHYANAWRALTR